MGKVDKDHTKILVTCCKHTLMRQQLICKTSQEDTGFSLRLGVKKKSQRASKGNVP